MNKHRGFTLIELLVVIAIIGILAAVILASLGLAQQRSTDAAVESDLQSIRNEAQIYASGNSNSYGTANGTSCNSGMYSDSTIANAITNVAKENGSGSGSVVCNSTYDAFAVQSPLVTGGYWCVDATGNSRADSTLLGSGVTTCP